MPGLKYFPGDYFVDNAEFYFVRCKKTNLYYGRVDGETDFSVGYSSLNQLLRERHPGFTSTSGKQRGFSAKSKIRILNVLLSVWENRGECFALVFCFDPRAPHFRRC